MKLQRSISLIGLMLVAVTAMLGSGWLFGPLYAAKMAGPSSILAWLLGGALIFVMALPFAELGSMFPITGGLVRFVQFSHGPLVALAMGLAAWYAAAIVSPIETLALIEYAANYIPGLMHEVGGTPVLTGEGMLAAVGLLAVLAVFNTLSARTVSKTNYFIVAIKIVIPLTTVAALILTAFHPHNFSVAMSDVHSTNLKNMLYAIPNAGIVFSFLGFTAAIQLAGESKNPKRVIFWALLSSMIICAVLYTLIQIAFIGAVNPVHLTHGWQHLSYAGDSGPFAGIAAGIGLVWLVYVLYADAFISPLGVAVVYTASAARINYALSKNGLMPKFMQKLNRKGVPAVAILANFIFGALVFLPFPGWQSMVAFLVSGFVFTYGVGPLALMVLRKKLPEHPRPFRLPFANVLTLISFYIGNLILFWTGWNTVSKLLIFLTAGLAALGIYKLVKKNGALQSVNAKAGLWLIPYLIGLAIVSYFGTFGGGKGVIPFGIDFLVIFLFSVCIYYLAYHCAFLKGTIDTTQFIPKQILADESELSHSNP